MGWLRSRAAKEKEARRVDRSHRHSPTAPREEARDPETLLREKRRERNLLFSTDLGEVSYAARFWKEEEGRILSTGSKERRLARWVSSAGEMMLSAFHLVRLASR